MSKELLLDYSAHSKWDHCPASWYEYYVNRRRRRFPPGQRSDVLALGTLVHAGMEVWQLRHVVEIPQHVVDEVVPTQECWQLAQELVLGYTRAYPEEHWPLVVCEEPVKFPIQEPKQSGWTGNGWQVDDPAIMGLAKIDTYFYVPEVTTIPAGINGLELTLSPGWWIHEYKTKSPTIDIALYQQSWETNLQASYQLLALQHKVREEKLGGVVQGILVNVMEKPKRHIPRRKCRGCKELQEFYTYLPTGKGTYQCSMCGVQQELQPLKENPVSWPPVFYRVLVQRPQAQLQRDLDHIRSVGQQMLHMRQEGLHSVPWNKSNCVNFKWRRACDYFQPHLSGTPTTELEELFEEPPDYRGLIQVEV